MPKHHSKQMFTALWDSGESYDAEKYTGIGVYADNGFDFCIQVEGCANNSTPEKSIWSLGEHTIAAIRITDGVPSLFVWADINREDPTHIIKLDGALETRRIDHE